MTPSEGVIDGVESRSSYLELEHNVLIEYLISILPRSWKRVYCTSIGVWSAITDQTLILNKSSLSRAIQIPDYP